MALSMFATGRGGDRTGIGTHVNCCRISFLDPVRIGGLSSKYGVSNRGQHIVQVLEKNPAAPAWPVSDTTTFVLV